MKAAALIMAGGSGERFAAESGASAPKQLTPLCGRAMIAWSAEALAREDRIAHLVVVAPAEMGEGVRAVLAPQTADKAHAFVAGGSTRQESVFNGLCALPDGVTHVLIHDAARPCASAALVERVLAALGEHDAVVPAVAATDTLIRDYEGRVDAVVDRVHVAGVQTPQGFRYDLILRAHKEARARGFHSSDDGSLVLALGQPVHTVVGERTNIKVTFREDVAIAEAILKNGVST